jgi:hypothetical protein
MSTYIETVESVATDVVAKHAADMLNRVVYSLG